MKVIENDIALIKGDTHISKWVRDTGTLEIAIAMLTPFKKYIPEGGYVVDVGASIGDHTVTYAKWVGDTGLVMAFEPYTIAYDCLVHNTKQYNQVSPINEALSDTESTTNMVVSDNSGASYTEGIEGDVITSSLDSYDLDRLDFIKIDAEGAETKIILGSLETIKACRPVMLVEVNRGALERAGTSSDALRDLIESLGYSIEITDSRIPWTDPQFDILCLPNEKTH